MKNAQQKPSSAECDGIIETLTSLGFSNGELSMHLDEANVQRYTMNTYIQYVHL